MSLTALIACMAFVFGCAEYGGAGNGYSHSSAETTPAAGPSEVSAGTQGDTLEACMARIPSNATHGQRMIAERTCQRDNENRQPILAVPGK